MMWHHMLCHHFDFLIETVPLVSKKCLHLVLIFSYWSHLTGWWCQCHHFGPHGNKRYCDCGWGGGGGGWGDGGGGWGGGGGGGCGGGCDMDKFALYLTTRYNKTQIVCTIVLVYCMLLPPPTPDWRLRVLLTIDIKRYWMQHNTSYKQHTWYCIAYRYLTYKNTSWAWDVFCKQTGWGVPNYTLRAPKISFRGISFLRVVTTFVMLW